MAKRFVDTDLFDKAWFFALSPKLKCLVQFVRLKCDIAGVWSPNYILASQYVGDPVTESDLLGIDEGRQFSKHSSGKIICSGFIEFQYGKLSDKCRPHQKVIATLDKHKLLDTLSDRVYDRVSDTLQEEDKEQEEEQDQNLEGGAGETLAAIPSTNPPLAQQFETFWIGYGKDTGRHECEQEWYLMTPHERKLALARSPMYVASIGDPKYHLTPLKWLRNKRFNDDPKTLIPFQQQTVYKFDTKML